MDACAKFQLLMRSKTKHNEKQSEMYGFADRSKRTKTLQTFWTSHSQELLQQRQYFARKTQKSLYSMFNCVSLLVSALMCCSSPAELSYAKFICKLGQTSKIRKNFKMRAYSCKNQLQLNQKNL